MRILRVLLGLLGFVLPRLAYAVTTPANISSSDTCWAYLPCPGGGAGGFSNFINIYVISGAQTIFITLGIIFFFYYAVRLITESDNESTIEETKNAYTYGVSGAVIVSIAGFIVDAIGSDAQGTLINEAPLSTGIGNVIFFLKIMVSVAVSVMIAFQGVRLILLQGQESEIEEQKKRFFHGLLGVAIVLLADAAVDAFLPGNAGSILLSVQIAGIINFVLTLIGALAILAFIVAGFMLVISTDETLKDRAKKTIFATFITLIIVLASYLIVHFVILL